LRVGARAPPHANALVLARRTRIGSYWFVLARIALVLARIGSYWLALHSYWLVSDSHWLVMARIFTLVLARIGSYSHSYRTRALVGSHSLTRIGSHCTRTSSLALASIGSHWLVSVVLARTGRIGRIGSHRARIGRIALVSYPPPLRCVELARVFCVYASRVSKQTPSCKARAFFFLTKETHFLLTTELQVRKLLEHHLGFCPAKKFFWGGPLAKMRHHIRNYQIN
jgi:hypothetical protein